MNSTNTHRLSPLTDREEIKAFLAVSENQFETKEKRYQLEIKLLKEQIRTLTDRLYGRKSEKLSLDDKQLLLFGETEDVACIPAVAEDTTDAPARIHKKRGRKAIPADLPRIDVVHDLNEEDKICECGCTKTRCGEEVSEQYDVIPPQYRVIRHIRPKYSCKSCEGVESDKPTVMIAPPPVQFIPKSNATAGLIAQIIAHKFADALPFYRQQKIFARHGVEIPRGTMCNWAIRSAENCKILLELLQKELLSGPLINADETPVQVHKESGRKNTSQSYMWVFYGGRRLHRSVYTPMIPHVQAVSQKIFWVITWGLSRRMAMRAMVFSIH